MLHQWRGLVKTIIHRFVAPSQRREQIGGSPQRNSNRTLSVGALDGQLARGAAAKLRWKRSE
jgi:hypothetical protein